MAKTAAVRKTDAVPQRVSIPDLDRTIHEKTRLAILSSLAVNPSLTFNELKEILNTTDGSCHARTLEEANYSRAKGFEGRMPRTAYS